MAYLDDAVINTIRRNHPIKEVVERYVPLTKKGSDYWGLCPFHPDNNASMSVSTRLDMFQCFSCHTAGNVFNFIANIENISYKEAIYLLAKEDGLAIGSVRSNPNQKYYEIMSLACKFYQNNLNSAMGSNAMNYLSERKIDRDTIKKFEIGLSVSRQPVTDFLLNKYQLDDLVDLGLTNEFQKDVFYDRIMIPIHDLSGNLIGFGGRVYQTRDSSKYVNTKATKIFDKSNILYNYHRAHSKLNKDDSIIIMEGYFDVIRASTIGVHNCVAPMGTSLTIHQIRLLKKITNHIILCFDGDSAGQEATIRAISLLDKEGIHTKVIRLEEKDPDEFIVKRGKDEFIKKLKNPLSVIDFKMQILKEGKNLNDTKDISNYLDELLKELSKEKDEFIVELTLKRLEKKFNVDYKTLEKRYQKYQSKQCMTKQEKGYLKINKKPNKGLNKYGQAVNNLLYYMTISPEIINYVTKKVIKIVDDKKRRLYNEIIYFYHKYNNIVIADFISYLTTKTDVYLEFQEILNANLKREYSDEEINDYINVINEQYKVSRIDELKRELSAENDPMKQAGILSEIMKIRGVNNND